MMRHKVMWVLGAIAVVIVVAWASGALDDFTTGVRDGFGEATKSSPPR